MRKVDPLAVGAVLADPRCGIRCDRARQLLLPFGDPLDHGVDRGVGMLQRQQLACETPERARGGDGLGERLLTELSSVTVRHSGFPFYLV